MTGQTPRKGPARASAMVSALGKVMPMDKRDQATRVLEAIAAGDTLKDISQRPGFPTRDTFYKWMMLYPDLKTAYDAARELSALSLEEEALDMARVLKAPNDFTGTKVRAYEVAMAQFRWSAERRDPSRYAGGQKTSVMVPIQINTTLDLGQQGGSAPAAAKTTYDFAASIARGEDGEAIAVDVTPEPETIGGTPTGDVELETPWELPEAPRAIRLDHPTPKTAPRRKKGHKTESQIRVTLASHAKRKKGTSDGSV